jgi:hypothetical protein
MAFTLYQGLLKKCKQTERFYYKTGQNHKRKLYIVTFLSLYLLQN